MDYLGSVEASVVGLSHLFRSATDSKGARLKKLAAFLGHPRGTAFGMLEVVLKRNKDIPADPNAVGILVPNQEVLSGHGKSTQHKFIIVILSYATSLIKCFNNFN